jgi:alcohol dehydrogenase class IV
MVANIHALRQRSPESAVLSRYDEVARLLTGKGSATADEGVKWVRQFVGDLQIKPLGTYGVREEHVVDLVAKAANASSMKANPVALTPEELAGALRQAL